jgi:hypothetical protein
MDSIPGPLLSENVVAPGIEPGPLDHRGGQIKWIASR